MARNQHLLKNFTLKLILTCDIDTCKIKDLCFACLTLTCICLMKQIHVKKIKADEDTTYPDSKRRSEKNSGLPGFKP